LDATNFAQLKEGIAEDFELDKDYEIKLTDGEK